MATNEKGTVDSVQTACHILDLLEELDGAGVTRIAEEVGLAKSTAHSHLATLEKAEYLVKRNSEYHLSLLHLKKGEFVKSRITKYDIVTTELDKLADDTGETVQFATEEHGWCVYLAKSKGKHGVESASSMGKREHLHSTSLGRAILSEYPEERVSDIMDNRGMPAKTEATTTDRDELFADLQTIREKGYAIDDEENVEGVRCIGAPVIGTDGGVLGALSVTGPSRRMTLERIEDELADLVISSANAIEINSKFS